MNSTVIVDNISVPYEGEKNLLEVIRKANIDLPTFCYNPELSVYGACRMCLVEVEGRGLMPACTTPVSDGMVVKTNTKQIRDIRKMIVELMLAHDGHNCTTCPKSGSCKLQKVANDLGVKEVRFHKIEDKKTVDFSSRSVVRDSSKCILCGECVRVCSEIQSVGALDFSNRGSEAKIVAGFNKPLGETECVNCGQCIKVCPVGALSPKSQIDKVWDAIYDTTKTVVVQVAPAVRVAIGEEFGYKPGDNVAIGKMVTALRALGFDGVYDTSYGADFTVIEEGNEFIERYTKGGVLPQFTSCCPAWVKFCEQEYPELIPNLSTCSSPQAMFGAVVKDQLTKKMGITRNELVVVSIMPCTAKKFEAARDEFKRDGNPDVDISITTAELAKMIKERGINFENIEESDFDMPFGAHTGAAVIFGTSGGVSEAVLRYAASQLKHEGDLEVAALRKEGGIKVAEITVGAVTLKLAIVSGLSNAREVIEKVKAGEVKYDLIEVMACPGGCVNGGGQPIHSHKCDIADRTEGLYTNDEHLPMRSSELNSAVTDLYKTEIDAHKAHELFHTTYVNRKD